MHLTWYILTFILRSVLMVEQLICISLGELWNGVQANSYLSLCIYTIPFFSKGECTALHYASYSGHAAAVEALLNYNFKKVNARNKVKYAVIIQSVTFPTCLVICSCKKEEGRKHSTIATVPYPQCGSVTVAHSMFPSLLLLGIRVYLYRMHRMTLHSLFHNS